MQQVLLLLAVPIFSVSMVTAQEKEIVILHTNDTHGRIFPVEINSGDIWLKNLHALLTHGRHVQWFAWVQ